MLADIFQGFELVLLLQGRSMTIEREAGTESYTVRIAPANFFRNFEGFEEVTIEGQEYVVSKKALEGVSFSLPPKKGDVLVDSDLGTNTVDYVKPLTILGQMVGYRLRTG